MTVNAKQQLKRLASFFGLTQRAMIDQLELDLIFFILRQRSQRDKHLLLGGHANITQKFTDTFSKRMRLEYP